MARYPLSSKPSFDAAWNRRRRWRRRWRIARWWLGLAAVLAGAALLARWNAMPGDGEQVSARFAICGQARGASHCVIDGDTIAIGRRKIRLTGFDAPELDGACEAETRRAAQARDALQDWLNAGAFAWDGGAQPPRDRYGRELRSAWRGDGWLSDAIIDAGLASDNGWGGSTVDWCA